MFGHVSDRFSDLFFAFFERTDVDQESRCIPWTAANTVGQVQEIMGPEILYPWNKTNT